MSNLEKKEMNKTKMKMANFFIIYLIWLKVESTDTTFNHITEIIKKFTFFIFICFSSFFARNVKLL